MNPTKAASLAVLLLIGVPHFALAAESGKLSVQGSATLYVEPDFVTATFTVERNAVLAADANQAVGQTMKRLLEVARGNDIPDVDLKTSGITGRTTAAVRVSQGPAERVEAGRVRTSHPIAGGGTSRADPPGRAIRTHRTGGRRLLPGAFPRPGHLLHHDV